MLTGLPVQRRVVLTGTPIQVTPMKLVLVLIYHVSVFFAVCSLFQNDLQEFYSIVEFCNPGIIRCVTRALLIRNHCTV